MRNANIGVGVAIVVLAIGLVLFRNAGDAALQAVAITGFISAFVVFHVLDERERRSSLRHRRKRRGDAN